MRPRLISHLLILGCLSACDRSVAPPAEATITLEPVVTLRGETEPGDRAALPSAVRALESGGYVVSVEPSSSAPAGLPRVYGADGQYRFSVGRIGEGPGEYRTPIVWSTLPGDSLVVTDEMRSVGAIIDSRGTLVRQFGVPVGIRQIVVTSDRAFIGNSPYNRNGNASAPLVRLDSAGRLVASFGGDSVGCARFCGVLGARRLAADAAGGVWAAHQTKAYILEHYDRAGSRTKQFSFSPDWFAPMDSFPPRRDDRTPLSMIHGLSLDLEGRLWVMGSTADSAWEEGLGDPRPGEGGSYRPVIDLARYRDGVLEVRDTATGALIASRRFPDSPVLLPVGPGLIAQAITDDDGWFSIAIRRVAIDQPLRSGTGPATLTTSRSR
jgi:hypothetical protein